LQQALPVICLFYRVQAPVDLTRQPIAEFARLANAAARMMQAYQEAFVTLQKVRTGGKQTVVVQHVQIGEGGQAVVAGSVGAGPRTARKK